ncbi:hypothetical protein BCV72DRAFT_303312 [Rhizopus microsporus var. microsporus]|uniref:Uncharacterized protein n=1 Tax=Rhizopus microsporus var. microsporus TaxID=86635 RepID=A0A1X0RA39_RHIZD|nr:hypothetical protein BCV72DRAFT_303312 [Rhizopus microsporus var. microsporus]
MSKLLNRSLKAAHLPYDPKESMNSWLHQFNLHFQRLSLTIEQKLLHINQYMPSDVANWTSLGTALLQTFGSMSSSRFAFLFESVIFDFPDGHKLDADTLKIIYLQDISPKIRQMVMLNTAKHTWRDIFIAATAIKEAVSLDTQPLLEDEFAKLALSATPIIQSDLIPDESVEIVDINALSNQRQHASSSSGSRYSSRSSEAS